MISKTVGDPEKATNVKQDVITVKKAFNKWQRLRNTILGRHLMAICRSDLLRVSDYIYLTEDGWVGQELVDKIIELQRENLKITPDGYMSPKKKTIQALCPMAFSRPTTYGVRSSDNHGKGHYGASRGTRKHKGTDYTTVAGQPVKAPMSGVVTRVSKPYANPSTKQKKINTGLQINGSDGTICKHFYVQMKADLIGEVVWPGEAIGTALSLQDTYSGITDHAHVQMYNAKGAVINPTTLIK